VNYAAAASIVIWLVLDRTRYSENVSLNVRMTIASALFLQVVVFMAILWRSFSDRSGAVGYIEASEPAAPLTASGGPDRSAIAKLCFNFAAWVINCFIFYLVVVSVLLPSVR
jgi:hypothetical protein